MFAIALGRFTQLNVVGNMSEMGGRGNGAEAVKPPGGRFSASQGLQIYTRVG